ncbi:MAG: zinc ABC transporter substrate-binding protein [Clostridia bacterium]|nr:zinc ABC transporter substrate-binding protein [Clostridia bacterium]
MNFKKIILIIILLAIIVGAGFFMLKGRSKKQEANNDKIKVVSSNFASYDFLRAIIGDNDNVELTFLLGPGKDAHSYDPTAQDLITIQNADIFVYIGGEMEKWSDKVLEAVGDKKSKIICIADDIDTIEEKEVDGAEEEEEHEHEEEHEEGAFDEHIWTSPKNAIKMVEVLEKTMEEIDNNNAEKYKKNSEKYIAEIKNIDKQIQNIVDNKKRYRLVFGDKMPMQYFIDYYNLKVSAAFNGCSTETEPSASTIAYLEKKVKEENIPVVLYVELNPGRVAKTIATEVGNGCEAMQIQALHNITLDDFKNGETWVSLMTRNLEVLKKALQ